MILTENDNFRVWQLSNNEQEVILSLGFRDYNHYLDCAKSLKQQGLNFEKKRLDNITDCYIIELTIKHEKYDLDLKHRRN